MTSRLSAILFIVTLMTTPLWQVTGQRVLKDPCTFPTSLGIDKYRVLVSIIEDEEIKASVKQCTLEHLGKLYSTSPEKNPQGAGEVIDAIIKLSKESNKKKLTLSELEMRQGICSALGGFDRTSHADRALNEIKEIIKSSENHDVNYVCVMVMGNMQNNRSKAIQPLLSLIDRHLKSASINQQDVRLMNLLVNAVGRLGDKEAYVTLMRVLQSGYPAQVKKATERAIHRLNL